VAVTDRPKCGQWTITDSSTDRRIAQALGSIGTSVSTGTA